MDKYNVLVQKLAEEIVESAIMEKEASAGADAVKKAQSFVSQKGAQVGAATAAGLGAGVGATAAVLKAKAAKEAAKIAARKKLIAGVAGAGAVGAGAGYLSGRSKKAAEYDEEMEVLAAEENDAAIYAILEKAASVYEEAQFLKQAAEEALDEAAIQEEAAIQIFDELGLLDDEVDSDTEDVDDGEYEVEE
jgi:hypothetical protein